MTTILSLLRNNYYRYSQFYYKYYQNLLNILYHFITVSLFYQTQRQMLRCFEMLRCCSVPQRSEVYPGPGSTLGPLSNISSKSIITRISISRCSMFRLISRCSRVDGYIQHVLRLIRTIISMFANRCPITFNNVFLHSICMGIGCIRVIVDIQSKT